MKTSYKAMLLVPFLCLSFLVLKGSLTSVVNQYTRLNDYLPVQAEIIEKELIKIPGAGRELNPDYTPHLKYTFQVKGRIYQGTGIYPIKDTRGRKWAQSVMKQFHIGKKVTAYYNPENPEESYLLRIFLFSPYFGVLIGVFFLAVAIVPLFFGTEGRITRVEEHYRMSTDFPYFRRRRLAWFLTAYFTVCGALVIGHYLANTSKPYDYVYPVFSSMYYLFTALCFCFAVYYFILHLKVGHLTFSTAGKDFYLEEPLEINVSFPLKRRCSIDLMEVELLLKKTVRQNMTGRGGGKKEVVFSKSQTVIAKQSFEAGHTVSIDSSFQIPVNKDTRTSCTTIGTGLYTWEIVVNLKFMSLLRIKERLQFHLKLKESYSE